MNAEETNVPIPDEWYKDREMRRFSNLSKTTRIIILSTALLLLIAALLYFVPWSTPIDETLTFVKLNHKGEIIGTYETRMQGKKLNYLFQDDRMLLSFEPFDDLKDIEPIHYSNQKDGVIDCFDIPELGRQWLTLNYGGSNVTNNNEVRLSMFFCEDFDRFAIICHASSFTDVAYITSIKGDYTTEELMEYFDIFLPRE